MSIRPVRNTADPNEAGALILEGTIDFPNNAGANTVFVYDFPAGLLARPGDKYLVTYWNPSAVTPVVAAIRSHENAWLGNTRRTTLYSLTIPSQQSAAIEIHTAAVSGDGGSIRFTNTSALGASDGFTVGFRIRRL